MIEEHKRYFEFELRRAKSSVDKMDGVVNERLLEPFKEMFSEYSHFKKDIEELMGSDGCKEELETEVAELQSRVDQLGVFEERVSELEDELADLNSQLAELNEGE